MAQQTNKELFCSALPKILKDQCLVDVMLQSGDGDKSSTISAHKLILSSRSEVFKKMFESDKCKTSFKMETITLAELKHEELEAFVEFIYSDGSMLTEKAKQHVRSLYTAADKYEIPHLRDVCRTQLISSINSLNAIKILELAQIPFDKALHDVAFATIKTSMTKIINSAEFKVFVVNHPELTVEIMKNKICSTCGRTCRVCYVTGEIM